MVMKHKRKEAGVNASNSRRRFSVLVKKELIAKYENGSRVSDIAKEYNVAKSTVSTIIKKKEVFKAAAVAKGVNVISKQRSTVLDEVEKLLLKWIKDIQFAGESVNEATICRTAKQFYGEMLTPRPNTSTDQQFKASRGWFDRFRRRSGIQSVMVQGEASSLYENESKEFMGKLGERNFITKEETGVPGYRLMKDTPPVLEYSGEIMEKLPGLQIAEMYRKWSDVQEFVEKYHPNKNVTKRVVNLMNDKVICPFKKILAWKEGNYPHSDSLSPTSFK